MVRLVLLGGALVGTAAVAQVAVSLRGAFLESWHQAQLRSTEDILDCGLLRSGTGSGWSAAVGVDFPLSPLRLELAFQLAQRGGTLAARNTFPIRDTITGAVIDVITEARLQSSWLTGELQSVLLLPFARRFQAFAGLRIGTPVATHFRQEEHIISPDTLFFVGPDGQRRRSRLLAEGKFRLPARFQLGLVAGIEHALSLGGSLEWVQRFGIEYTPTSLLPDAVWRLWGARVETGFRMRLGAPSLPLPPSPPAPVSPPQPLPSPPVEAPALTLVPLGLTARVRTGQELYATPPVVLAVFFEHNSARIPERYIQSATAPDTLVSLDPLEAHRYVLPYVSWLLQRHAAARIVLEGATSGDDEPEGIALAQQRAEAVRRALQALGVPAERITVRASLLPRTPSNPTYPEGRAENRRVDIVLQNAPSIEYVRRQLFRELVGELSLQVECRGMPEEERLELSLSCGDSLRLVPCTPQEPLRLPFSCRLPATHQGSFPLQIRAASTRYGVAAEALLEVLPENYLHDTVALDVRRFRAILRFDYNSSELLPEVQERLRQLVELLPAHAQVIIYGSTDALGTERRNVELTEERAQKTAQFLRRLAPTLMVRTLPLPPRRKFDETFPEGRFLNRSIWVEVNL